MIPEEISSPLPTNPPAHGEVSMWGGGVNVRGSQAVSAVMGGQASGVQSSMGINSRRPEASGRDAASSIS
jgi:hypothetical protein